MMLCAEKVAILNITQSTLLNIPTFAAIYSNISH